MALALFDLDNTLLGGDSDYLWGRFLADRGLVDSAAHEAENLLFYKAYQEGNLDIHAYLEFAARFLAQEERTTLEALHREFMAKVIEPIILPRGRALIQRHQAAGDTVMIITATNRFVTAPIAAALGVAELLATELEEGPDGRFTGRGQDVPCFQRGKVVRLERWLVEHQATLEGSWFYSDSHNDLPLLELVDNPVAVDPDPTLQRIAEERGWSRITLR